MIDKNDIVDPNIDSIDEFSTSQIYPRSISIQEFR